MKQIDKNFPYPILIKGYDDYQEKYYFKVQLMKNDCLETHILLSFKYELNSDFLKTLLAENKAQVICQVFCRTTFLRQIYFFNENDIINIKLLKNEVKDEIQFAFMVVATEDILGCPLDDFDDFNKVYFNKIKIDFKKYDRLAIGEIYTIFLEEYDTLKPLKSIIEVKVAPSTEAYVRTECNSDKIQIYINQEIFDEYCKLRSHSDVKIYLSSIIVFPALVEVLSLMKNSQELDNIENYRWYRKLLNFLQDKDLKIDDERGTFFLANQLLHNSLGKALQNLDDFIMQDQGRD